MCLIEPFLRKLGVAEGLGTSLLGLAPPVPSGSPNSFLLLLGLAWILAIFSASSLLRRRDGRLTRLAGDFSSSFLKDSFLATLGLASSSVFFLSEGLLTKVDVSSLSDFLTEGVLVKVCRSSSFFPLSDGLLISPDDFAGSDFGGLSLATNASVSSRRLRQGDGEWRSLPGVSSKLSWFTVNAEGGSKQGEGVLLVFMVCAVSVVVKAEAISGSVSLLTRDGGRRPLR